MTDHPIIFSAPMIRALLREVAQPGTGKTMTRRLAWRIRLNPGGAIHDGAGGQMDYIEPHEERSPSPWQRVRPGDRLWVRESCMTWEGSSRGVSYHADHQKGKLPLPTGSGNWEVKIRPSIHMPRWASRLTLTVTATKLERLQDISEDDAIAEGISWSDDYEGYHTEDCRHFHGRSAARSFEQLWEHLHGPDAWAANPELVCPSFTVAVGNIDEVAA